MSVIDCQCRDKDLITSQTTIITPSKFKFTFAGFMFALRSTSFVPKLTGCIKIQVRMPHSENVLQETSEDFFCEIFYSLRKLSM